MKKTKMLKKNYEFRKVLSKGKYYSGELIEAFVLENKAKSNYLGLAISTKSGKAYQRNRIKRLLRENYKNIENSIKNGQTIVFLWKKKKDIDLASFEKIKKDMQMILQKAEIIEEKEK